MGSIPVYLIHYLEFIILHFGMCIRKRRTCTFVTTTLYLNLVGFIAGSRPPYPYIGSIYPREWWDLPLALTSWQVFSHFPTMPNFGCNIVRYICLVLCDHRKLWHDYYTITLSCYVFLPRCENLLFTFRRWPQQHRSHIRNCQIFVVKLCMIYLSSIVMIWLLHAIKSLS